MSDFSICMILIGGSLLLTGFIFFISRNFLAKLVAWQESYKDWYQNLIKNIGKWVMIVSSIFFILAIGDIIFHFYK